MDAGRWPAVTLVPIASVDRTALRWLRTAEEPMTFSLAAEDNRVAEIHWSRKEGSARAEVAGASWKLARGGFLSPHVTVRAEGADSDLARVSAHLNFHRIEIRGGSSYRFHRAGHLVPAWAIATEAGAEVAHIEPVREGRSLVGGAVLAEPPGSDSPDLLLLLVTSWYFIGLSWFEDEVLIPFEGSDKPDATAAKPDASAGSPGS